MSDSFSSSRYFPNSFKLDDVIEKIYANMSACHMKNENWQRALETANKVGTIYDPA